MIAYSDFVTIFPEFDNAVVHPQARADFWIGQGYAQINASALGAQLDLAVMLFTAHNLIMASQSAAAVARGGAASSGVVSSKSVDKVSVSYDTGSTTINGAGHYNATTYGQRLYRLLQAASVGRGYRPWRGPDGTIAGVR